MDNRKHQKNEIKKFYMISNIFLSVLSLMFGIKIIKGDNEGFNYDEANTVNCSRDGRYIAVGYSDLNKNARIGIWDFSSEKMESIWEAHEAGDSFASNRAGVITLNFDPTGNRLASAGTDGIIYIWKIPSGEKIKRIENHAGPVNCVRYSPNGSYLVAGGKDIHIWNIVSGDETIIQGHSRSVESIDIDAEEKYIVSGSRDGTVRLWDIKTGIELRNILKIPGDVWEVEFDTKGRIITGSSDGKIRIFNTKGTLLRTIEYSEPVRKFDVDSNKNRIIVNGSSNTIHMNDLENGDHLKSFAGNVGRYRSICFGSKGERIIAVKKGFGGIQVWDVKKRLKSKVIINDPRKDDFIALTPSGYSKDNYYDRILYPGEIIPQFYCYDIYPEKDIIVFGKGTEFGRIELWDVSNGKTKYSSQNYHNGVMLDIAFNHNGKYLGTVSPDRSVKLWEVLTGKLRKTFHGHQSTVSCLDFSPQGGLLASGSYKGNIIIRDLKNGNIKDIFHAGKDIRELKYSNNGEFLCIKRYVKNKQKRLAVLDVSSSKETGFIRKNNIELFEIAPEDDIIVTYDHSDICVFEFPTLRKRYAKKEISQVNSLHFISNNKLSILYAGGREKILNVETGKYIDEATHKSHKKVPIFNGKYILRKIQNHYILEKK